jgi:hypothetical protein
MATEARPDTDRTATDRTETETETDRTAERWPRILWVTGWVLLATLAFHLVALVATGGPWTGPVSLRKPATFAETGWLACWSVALLLPALGMRGWPARVTGAATVLFAVGETAIIGLQAWRGVPSHYNFSTPLDAALMRGGAAGTAGIFLAGVAVLLVAAGKAGQALASVRIGALAGGTVLLIGCLVGLVMIFNNSGVYQGTIGAGFTARRTGYLGPDAATVGPDYALIRPATAGGDLVLPHAIGVHGLVLLAVPAVLLARTALAERLRRRLVGLAAASVLTAQLVLVGHALRGLPLHALPPIALALLGLCGIGLATSYLGVGAALARQQLLR